MKIASAFAAVIIVLANSASANANSGKDWFTWTLTLIPESSLQTGLSGEIVEAQAETGPGDNAPGSVAFMCLNSELMAVISYEDVDIGNLRSLWDKPRLRNTNAELVVNGEGLGSNGYTHSRSQKLLLPQKPSDRSRLYNAVLRQTDVKLRWGRLGDLLELHLPEPNEAFRTFGSECGLGLYGKGVRQSR